MTLLEMLLALLMLVTFSGVVILTLQFLLEFVRVPGTCIPGASKEVCKSQSVVVNQQQIALAMDKISEVISQPGFAKSDIDRFAFDYIGDSRLINLSSADKLATACTGDPVGQWSLEIPELLIPVNYSFCLWRTSKIEPELSEMLSGQETPAIYVLQALPAELSPFVLPARRIICRPRPFC